VILPLSLLKDLTSLRFVGFLCVGANGFTFVVIGLRFFFGHYVKAWPDVLHGVTTMTNQQIWLNTDQPAKMLTAIPIFTQIFNAHWVLLPLFSELRDPTRGRMAVVTGRSLAITSGLYLFSGLLGYLTWLEHTQSNVLLDFARRDGLMMAARCLVTIAATCSCPAVVMVLRQMLGKMGHKWRHQEGEGERGEAPEEGEEGYVCRFMLSAVLLLSCTTLAVFVPGLDVAFGLTGSFTASIIIYIVPGLLYLRLDPVDEALGVTRGCRCLAALCVVWGVVMGVVCSGYIIITNS